MGLFDALRGLFGGSDDDEDGATGGSGGDVIFGEPEADDAPAETGVEAVAREAGASGEDPGADGVPTAPADSRVVEHYEERARELVAEWPDYDLDYTVESLARLDELVAAEYDRSDGDRDYEGDPLDLEEAALRMPSDGSPMTVGGYFAEVLRRNHDAQWLVQGADELLVVSGEDGETDLEPVVLAVACFDGESSFVDAYARVAADVGLALPFEAED